MIKCLLCSIMRIEYMGTICDNMTRGFQSLLPQSSVGSSAGVLPKREWVGVAVALEQEGGFTQRCGLPIEYGFN